MNNNKPIYIGDNEYEPRYLLECEDIAKEHGMPYLIKRLEFQLENRSKGYRGHAYQEDVLKIGVVKGLKLAQKIYDKGKTK